MIYIAHEFAIWAGLYRKDLSLLHTVLAGMTQLTGLEDPTPMSH